jgi:hypothetical protein
VKFGGRRRLLTLAGLGALGGAAALTWPFLALFIATFGDRLHPDRIDWEAKNAWLKCEGAVAGALAWPASAPKTCDAMMLCANEAPLTAQQSIMLKAQTKATPGCGEP